MSKRLASLVVVALVVVAGLGVLIGRQTAPSTTSTSTSTTTTVLTAQPVEAVWPFAATAARFTDPLTAAFSFAHDYLGMTQPLLGAFQRGDSRSGEFSLRANATGPVTTVMVRQLTADNTWWVIGAACADIADYAQRAGVDHFSRPAHRTQHCVRSGRQRRTAPGRQPHPDRSHDRDGRRQRRDGSIHQEPHFHPTERPIRFVGLSHAVGEGRECHGGVGATYRLWCLTDLTRAEVSRDESIQ